jgi:uncharacterized protein
MPDVPETPEHSIAPAVPCPICGKPAVHEFRPFCSKRCADIDLHRWLKGVYVIPLKEEDDADGEKPRDDGARSED